MVQKLSSDEKTEAEDYKIIQDDDDDKDEEIIENIGDDYKIMDDEDDDAEERPSTVSSKVSDNISLSGSLYSIETISTLDSDRRIAFKRLNSSDRIETEVDFLKDDPNEMTYSRRIALHLLKSYKWYNPNLEIENISKDSNDDENDTPSGVNNKIESNDEEKSSNKYHVLESNSYKGNRNMNNDEKPSLEKAWAFFDHVTLPRYLYQPKKEKKHSKKHKHRKRRNTVKRIKRKLLTWCGGGDKNEVHLDMAYPGENSFETKLYSPIFTPLNQMGDFGLGIGLYFSTLRFIALLTFIAGIINIPNIAYFMSEEYSGKQEGVSNIFLKGSALCSIQQWVPCPSCSKNDFSEDYNQRLAVTSSYYDEEVIFALKNNCNMTHIFKLGMINIMSLLFIICGMIYIDFYQKKKEVLFDEDEQTAQDYSISISNPPKNATDPEEWKGFFENEFNGVHVTCCTIALNNESLVSSLVQRRELFQMIKHLIPNDNNNNNNKNNDWHLETFSLSMLSTEILEKRNIFESIGAKLGMINGIPELFHQLLKVNSKIRTLSQKKYEVTKVFITFETEAGQRRVLNALSGKSSLKFQYTHTLKVKEAEEPSDVRWLDLSQTFIHRATKVILTSYVCICSIILVAFIIDHCRHSSPMYTAAVISGCNIAFPQFALMLTNYERHSSESRKQTSLYVKIAVFRWVNTAIVITFISPFTSTLTDGNNNVLDRVHAIFFAEILMTNTLQLADPSGFIKRHILAPRAKTQEAMNVLMQGGEYDLAERYTNMTKILFLAFYYCAIYPASFFMCALYTFVTYYVDSFCMMRTWKQAPRMGTKISSFSRRYFFTFAVVAMAVASSYSWSGFPYDNICESDDTTGEYEGSYYVRPINDKSTNFKVSISEDTPTYHYCSQDFMNRKTGVKFPAFPKYQTYDNTWMTKDQESLNVIYGWTSLFIVIGACLYIAIRFLKYIKKKNNNNSYESIGDDQGIAFSHVASISSYIPQVKSDYFPYPLLAFDTSYNSNINEDLYEWKDPEKTYSYYDITKDVKEVFMGTLLSPEKYLSKCVFSRVKHWQPKISMLVQNNKGKDVISKVEDTYVLDSPNGQWRHMAKMVRN